MKLKDNVVIVTGAASGFGKVVAEQMAANGASDVVADLDDKNADIGQLPTPLENAGDDVFDALYQINMT